MARAQLGVTAVPLVASSVSELIAAVAAAVVVDGDRVRVVDESALRDDPIRDLAWTSTFATEDSVVDAARWLIWETSQALGIRSASIHDLYMARGRGEVSGFTVPAINLRAQTFDMARTACETAEADDVGAVIFELARSEQTYTYQRPPEYSASVLAGAIAAGRRAPVFIQGDHYQFNAKKYATDPEAMTEEIRKACRLAIDSGYRNIDIDSSTLVDLSRSTVDKQQHENYMRAAELTALIRSVEPDVTIGVGGEIGEVGKENSNEAELRAYLDGYKRELRQRAPDAIGLSKVSVQTGTSHGGVPLPGGGVAEVKLDFEVLKRLGEVARSEYGLAGAVQHGASTLPDELFHRFPAVETAEIHLATGFQNLMFDHPAFPKDLHAEIERWCFENAADERKPGQTDEQFIYSTRKKAIGPFKRQLWELDTRDEILAAQRRKISFLFTELAVIGSQDMVDGYIEPLEIHRPLPEALRSAVAAG
jgi:fructose/tagatose bisphosphate aldolase